MISNINIAKTIQIETTSRCTLQCPACSRTQFAQTFNRPVPTRDLEPDVLWQFFDCAAGKQIENFLLCGDWGDCIYYPHLFELIDLFRSIKTFTLVTNGSYQKPKFWHELVSRLDNRDTVMFSIDGLEDTNHLYRRNCDWPTILSALEIVAESPVNLEWATNVFSFNYDKLDEIKKLAESFGAKFVCKLTSRFGDPTLEPPKQFVNQESRFYPGLVEEQIVIEPQCQSTSKNMISSHHMYVPCGPLCAPFVFHKTAVWKEKNRWSIRNTTMDRLLEQVLQPWVDEIQRFPIDANTVCKMLCKPGQRWHHEC